MEMNPLVTNRQVLAWLCACPAPEATGKWKNRAQIAFTTALFVAVIGCIIGSTIFFMEYASTELEDALNAMFPIAAATGLVYMIVAAIILRYRIKGIFEGLKKIYKANEKEDLICFLAEANEKSEWIWKNYFRLGMGGFMLNNIMMSGASIAFCLMTYGVFDTKHLFHAYKFILPWDQETKLGYFVEICYDIVVGESYFFANGSLLLFFISICWHHLAFYNRFQYTISKLGDPKDPRKDKQLLCELIRFHNLVKSWFLESANVYSPFILVQLVSSMVFLALIVFQLDLQIKHIDFSAVIILTGGLVSASNLFFFCFFGKLATKSYENMAICLFESNWLELPVDLKKYLIMMIASAQRPMFYHGSGLARLQLESFTYCIKTVFTYYMMFKTLTKN